MPLAATTPRAAWRHPAATGLLTLTCLAPLAALSAPAPSMQHHFFPYPDSPALRPETVSVDVAALPGGGRQFRLASTQVQREGGPATRVVTEATDAPRVVSPSPLFDALFAMAVDDARLNSVAHIRDSAYNDGQPIACRCFQTGELWHYVWTRDLAYATHLGLAWLDPQRAATSLLYKTSGWRAGVQVGGLPPGSLQIVQDTGSGGSWPVSTDRVSWAFGAQSVLEQLQGEARQAFAARARAALQGTVEADRLAAFDPVSGLYGGEQSFLDWRVQSYAPWITDHLARMSGARALSTNVAHFQALSLLARLHAAEGDEAAATRYQGWAEKLREAINRVFWLEDVQQYASLTNDGAQPVALHKFDLLGTSLAILTGVATPERAAQALARYPHAPFGAPVIAPQQPGVPVYHNRAIWPFVSAYALRAAARVGNTAVAGHALDSLLRAAALNLSNMENLEWLSGQPRFDDGPVINSRRQIWSVAAYLGAVAQTVFGWQVEGEGLRIEPFLTTAARRALGDGPQAVLAGMAWRGRPVEVVLALPPLPTTSVEAAEPAYYPVKQLRLNGLPVSGVINWAQLNSGANRIEVEFAPAMAGDTRIHRVPTVDPLDRTEPRLFAPDAPRMVSLTPGSEGVVLHFSAPPYREALRFNLYRDGRQVATGLETTTWTDRSAQTGRAHVYELEAVGVVSQHHSHLSQPARLEAGTLRQHRLGEWFSVEAAGRFGLELLYDNHAYRTETGVTNAVKQVRVLDAQQREVARGIVQMPHVEPHTGPHTGPATGQHPLRTSTLLRTSLAPGRYRVELADFFNMSYLQTNADYSGPGGRSGALNDAAVHAVQVLVLPQGE